jgi:ankyrin repeat protein
MLLNPSLDINAIESENGINSFWFAALYGQGNIMKLLAEHGIDIFNKH